MGNEWLERELEDCLVDDPYILFTGYYEGDRENKEVGLLGRQIKCRYGIIDLLFYSCLRSTSIPVYTVTLVELKAVQANHRTVEQVMRYMAAIEQIGFYAAVPSDHFAEYGHMVDSFIHFESVIVAPSFDDSISWFPNKIIVEKTDGMFEFTQPWEVKGTYEDNDPLRTALSPLFPRVAESARQWHKTSGANRG